MSAPPKPELLPAPREVPRGLRLRILAAYDVVASAMFTLPAAGLLAIGMSGPWPESVRWAFVVISSVLTFLGLQAAIPSLVAAVATLRRMREGTLTLGRVISCRYAWDKKGAQTPYAQFLGDFAGIAAAAQMGKVTGCLVRVVIWIFVVPFALLIALAGLALLLRHLGVGGGAQMAGDVDAAYVGAFAGTFVLGTVLVVLLLLAWRKFMLRRTGHFVGRSGTDGIEAGDYEEHLRAEAAKRSGAIRLDHPLPAHTASSMPLICRIEYAAGAQRIVAEGRLRLSDRLNAAGVEPLLYDPANPERVEILAGLPPGVGIEKGRWREVSPIGPVLGLAFSGAMASAAVALLAVSLGALWP